MTRMTTKEALAGGDYYPGGITLRAQVADAVPALALAQAFAGHLLEAGLGGIVRYSVAGMEGKDAPGSQAVLETRIAEHEDGPGNPHYFHMVTSDETEISFTRGMAGRPMWSIEARYPSGLIPEQRWLTAMSNLIIAAARTPGFKLAELTRDTTWMSFVPSPPLARYHHVTTVTDAEVAAAYEDPSSFPHEWKGTFFDCWDRVERVGEYNVCIRALEELSVHHWLAKTFENTMHLVRIAKPKLTRYGAPGEVDPAFAAWWEFGDLIADEAAGYPALSLIGYDPGTRTVEYAGFCTNTPVNRGGEDPRHVLIREIHALRGLVKAKKDHEGRPVDTVRIVFLEEWMARRERRPLLDAGARVFYAHPKSGELIEVTD